MPTPMVPRGAAAELQGAGSVGTGSVGAESQGAESQGAGSQSTWESVLAAVEADVERSMALLTAPQSAGSATASPRGPLAPAEVQLPAGNQTRRDPAPTRWPAVSLTAVPPVVAAAAGTPVLLPAPVLPDPATMPDVPPALFDRVQQLHDRIDSLRQELQDAMEEIGAHLAAISAPTHPLPRAAQPRYLDRLA